MSINPTSLNISCLKTLALNILKNSSPDVIANSIEVLELESCSLCNQELFLYEIKKPFTILACGHLYHRDSIESSIKTSSKCLRPNCMKEIESIVDSMPGSQNIYLIEMSFIIFKSLIFTQSDTSKKHTNDPKLFPDKISNKKTKKPVKKESYILKDLINELSTEPETAQVSPKRRRWEVNGAIQPSIIHAVYFIDPKKESRPLLEKIQEGQFVALHGPRASGKSTRVLQLQDQLNNEGFICIYVSLEQINIETDSINSANDFSLTFQKSKWENQVVLFIDEFDMLYSATDDVRSSCLNTFRGIKTKKDNYAIKSIFAIGPFSILHLNSNNFTASPFNVNEPFQNPNFTKDQVKFLYKEFADEHNLTIDQEVIEDIYTQTNGHAGLVCLCGRAIFRKLLSKGSHLSYDIWQHFTTLSLGNEILEYPTFIKMRDVLLKDNIDTRRAVNLIRSDFLINNDPIYVAENKKDLVLFLTAEGVLVPGEDAGTFKISSPLVHWLLLQRIIPHVFPTSPQTEVPYHSSPHTLDIFKVLKQTVLVFDKETIKSLRSYKIAHMLVNNAKNERVPRESVYDVELYRIISNWLGGFTITGQWHLKYRASEHINNKYVDIVISRPDHPTIVLELLAKATKKELNEHYERALLYDKKLPADETWVIHFTCEENAISKPCWPIKSQLQKGLRVVYLWHDLDFTKIRITACWWDVNNNKKHVTDVEEFMLYLFFVPKLYGKAE
ncbi:4837_t:CDS:2 [Cetraspora pellucida]|uniref:4837_t:CDS:1 n=1 Tax=Cetraspora pellucida TaxID=1433469 RepID=A0ACA9K897_9GLOM|nr:4837_t:CDS:2 [Cetraspora pellucida]